MKKAVAMVLIFGLLGGAGASPAGAATLIRGLGGSAGFGESSLGRNDDASSGPIEITETFPDGLNFFGRTYTRLFVNNNGNITFASPLAEYTPFAITGVTANPIIAPFFADVDTRASAGHPTPGGTSTGSNLVYWDLDAESGILTVTWDDVGYFVYHNDKRNAFQVRLIDTGFGDFDIEFRYEAAQWTTGDASGGSGGLGGNVARAGWSSGNGKDYYELPQSGKGPQMLALETSEPILFHVRSGMILRADVALAKTAGTAEPGVGEEVVFTIRAQNLGPDAARDLRIQDRLPDSLAYVRDDARGLYDPATGLWSIPELAPDSEATLRITARPTRPGEVNNTARLFDAASVDPDPSNDTASALVRARSADLVVRKTAAPEEAAVGEEVVFTICAQNLGPDAARDLRIQDRLPDSLAYVRDDARGLYDPATGLWSIPELAPDSEATLRITARVQEPGEITNRALREASNPPDPFPENDIDEASVSGLAADLEVGKQVEDGALRVGDTAVFRIAVRNAGPHDATAARIRDVLPDGLHHVGDDGAGAFDPGSGIWEIPRLPAGGVISLQIQARVTAAGDLTNTALRSASFPPDLNPVNDRDSITLRIPRDSDADGMGDAWEWAHFGTLSRNGEGDLDGDGLPDLQEFEMESDPTRPDTDGDLYFDYEEATLGTDPADLEDHPIYPPGEYFTDIESGDDRTGSGTAARPWKTLHHAIHHLNDGSPGRYTLRVRPGTYDVVGGETDGPLVIHQPQLRLAGDPAGRPVLDGTGAAAWTEGLSIAALADNVLIYGLAFRGFPEVSLHAAGRGLRLRDCDLQAAGGGTIVLLEEVQDAVLEGNRIQGSPEGGALGLVVTGGVGITVRENILGGNLQAGITAEDADLRVERNLILDTDSGIIVRSRNGQGAPEIRNNMIYAAGRGVELEAGAFALHARLYHNTFDGAAAGIRGVACSGALNRSEIRYNIITRFADAGIVNQGGTPRVDYNDVWDNGTDYLGTSSGDHDISEDPLLDAFALRPESPCMDAVGGEATDPVSLDLLGYLRPRGPGHDMGAIEYVAPHQFELMVPGGSGLPDDYRLFTVPLTLGTGRQIRAAMETALGSYDPALWRVFAWHEAAYVEMKDPRFDTLPALPARGYMIISRKEARVFLEGFPAPDGIPFEIRLASGWNLIGLPWLQRAISLGHILVSDGIDRIPLLDADNALTEQAVWRFLGAGSGYLRLDQADDLLTAGEAVWIHVSAAGSVFLLIPTEDTDILFAPAASAARRPMDTAGEPASSALRPPALPPPLR